MGYQFIHIEGYSLNTSKKAAQRWTVRQILAEAMREPEACPHVHAPRPPEQHGPLKLHEIEAQIRARMEQSSDVKGRKIRSDALVLLAGVASYPEKSSDIQDDAHKRVAFRHWLKMNVDFLRAEFGSNLVNVTVHFDETYAHVHFYCIPEPSKTGFNIDGLHPGKREEKHEKAKTGKSSKAAYEKGLRAFQDRYFAAVALKAGQTRLGPRKRRLSRAQWRAEQQAAKALNDAQHQAQAVLDQANADAALVTERSKPSNIFKKVVGMETSVEVNAKKAAEQAQHLVVAAQDEVERLRQRIADQGAQLAYVGRVAQEHAARSDALEKQNQVLQAELAKFQRGGPSGTTFMPTPTH